MKKNARSPICAWPWPDCMTDDQLLITGPVSFLIPDKISHVLRVCLVAELKFRIS